MSADIPWLRFGLGILVVVAATEFMARRSGARLGWLRIGAVSAVAGCFAGGAVVVAASHGLDSPDILMIVFYSLLAIVLAVVWFVAGQRPKVRAEPAAPPNSRPPSQLPASPQIQSSDSQRTPSSGGCG